MLINSSIKYLYGAHVLLTTVTHFSSTEDTEMVPSNTEERKQKSSKLMKIDSSDSVFKKNRADYRGQNVWVVRKVLFEEVTSNSTLERSYQLSFAKSRRKRINSRGRMSGTKALEWDIPRYGYAGAARKWVCSEPGKKHRASGGQKRQNQRRICDDQGVELESNLKRITCFILIFKR